MNSRDSTVSPADAFFQLKAGGLLCFADGEVEHLPRRLRRPLSVLLNAQRETVTKGELIESCWPGAEIGEQSLARAISDLRKLFKRHGLDPIKTVYGVGYRLEARADLAIGSAYADADVQSPIAEVLHQEARLRIHTRRPQSLEIAERLLAQAATIRKEPADWLAIAEAHAHKILLGYSTVPDAWPQLRTAAERAMEGRPAEALAMLALGLCWAEWDFRNAEEMLERARRIAPESYLANQCSAYHAHMTGNLDLAIFYFRRAIDVNPVALHARASIALCHLNAGAAREALTAAREMDAVDSQSPISLGYRALLESRVGDPERGLRLARQCFSLLPESPPAAAILALALVATGQTEPARTLLNAPSINGEPFGNVTSYACWAWLRLGDYERSLAALRRCLTLHCPHLPATLRDPAMDPVSNDSEFRDVFETVFRSLGR